ncbi:regulatory protein YycH of two-component signal transduction system YycFG [Scopulibacillus darangshiensis]|uniref:Regulatory protein YycH of two-component signal transduction system YycFG n=1 Tax=Scopulibacillus darangshiensis TaxID=442528 RepID=A0A4R2NQ57_9BACL|nr:two-component system activity regulator YycH [Scopulibacillus darangshiensis]TCP23435.1 regulatory protein YycH of two-component signal transduction system YycFG [Scopulibacillus darangshiensis]
MKRETLKTVFLTVLVFLSVALTWNILFFQTDYKKVQGPGESIENIAIAESRELADVVQPYLAVYHLDDQIYGQPNSESVAKVYSLMLAGKYSNVFPLGGQGSLPEKHNNNSYEIIFSAPLTIDTLTQLFQFNRKELTVKKNVLIDRVEVYKPFGENRVIAVFKTPNGSPAFYATVSSLDLNDLKSTMPDKKLVPYFKQRLKDKVVFLPDQDQDIPSILSYYDTINFEDFKQILFPNPENAFYNNGTYQDSSHKMEKNANVLQYVNATINNITPAGGQDPILHSFDYINSHKGWTDSFIYDGLSQSPSAMKDEVNFRLKLGDYSVYSLKYSILYLPSINLVWKNGELRNLNRTLLNFNKIGEKDHNRILSGSKVLDRLNQKASLTARTIEDLRIGYRLRPVDESIPSINLVPEWFYKQGGKWHSVADELAPKKPIEGEKQP